MLKRMTVLMLSLGVVTVFLTAPASADVLQVQFQQNTGSADQAGWLQIAGPGPSLSHTVSGGDFNGVGIAATGSHVRSYGSVDHSDGDLDEQRAMDDSTWTKFVPVPNPPPNYP